jgi:hypothetical protein
MHETSQFVASTHLSANMHSGSKLKGMPSILENYRVFFDGEGVVAESLPM